MRIEPGFQRREMLLFLFTLISLPDVRYKPGISSFSAFHYSRWSVTNVASRPRKAEIPKTPTEEKRMGEPAV